MPGSETGTHWPITSFCLSESSNWRGLGEGHGMHASAGGLGSDGIAVLCCQLLGSWIAVLEFHPGHDGVQTQALRLIVFERDAEADEAPQGRDVSVGRVGPIRAVRTFWPSPSIVEPSEVARAERMKGSGSAISHNYL